MDFFITGLLIGIVSLVPGISGGTIILLRKNKEDIYRCIANYKVNKKLIIYLISGIGVGAVLFSRVIEVLFKYLPIETMTLFFGFLLFSTPKVLIKERENLNIKGIIVGLLIILILNMSISKGPRVINNYPNITIPFLLTFGLMGSLDGILTILPGISGSMVMMMLGPYYLYKSYLANLSLKNIRFLIPIGMYFIFDLFGVVLGSKLNLFLLEKNRKMMMSVITGFVIMSLIIIFPLKEIIEQKRLLTSITSLIISFIIMEIIKLLEKN